jgi:hypothetical protein
MLGQNLSEDRALETQVKVLIPIATKAEGSPKGPYPSWLFLFEGRR